MWNSFVIGWLRAMKCVVWPFAAIGMIALVAWDALTRAIDTRDNSR